MEKEQQRFEEEGSNIARLVNEVETNYNSENSIDSEGDNSSILDIDK